MPGAASRARLLYVNPTPGTPGNANSAPVGTRRGTCGVGFLRLGGADELIRAGYPTRNFSVIQRRCPPLRQPMWQI